MDGLLKSHFFNQTHKNASIFGKIAVTMACSFSCIFAQAGNVTSKEERNTEESRGRQDGTFAQHLLTSANQTLSSEVFNNIHNFQAFFDTLKTSLQIEWTKLFGEGTSEIPWNGGTGTSCLCDATFVPAPIGFWIKDHVFMDKFDYVYGKDKDYLASFAFKITRFIPSSSHFSEKDINGKKELYRAYIKGFFNKKTLPECGEYVRDGFCKPVADLLLQACHLLNLQMLEEKTISTQDLQAVLKLYSAYRQFGISRLSEYACGIFQEDLDPQPNINKVCQGIECLMSNLYINIQNLSQGTQEWLLCLLGNCHLNRFSFENLRSYMIHEEQVIQKILQADPLYLEHNPSIMQDTNDSEDIQQIFQNVVAPKKEKAAEDILGPGYTYIYQNGFKMWIENDGSLISKMMLSIHGGK